MLMGPNEPTALGRNHFTPAKYFDANVRGGILRSKAGARMITLNEDFVIGLHRALEDETGAAAPAVLYTVGKWWGERFVKQHELELRQLYQNEIGELPLGIWEVVLRRVWALYGWGRIEMSFALQDRGFVEVVVASPFYSDAVGQLGRTTDHLLAGAIASIVRHLAGRDLEACEVACKSKGDADCRFLVGLKSRVNIIEAWVKQGRSRDDIVGAIQSGELA